MKMKRNHRSNTGWQPATTAYFESQAIKQVVETAEKRARGGHWGNKAMQKAVASAHKHGLAVKIGKMYYPVPRDLSCRVMGFLTKERNWGRDDGPLRGAFKYIGITGESLSRKNKTRRIVLSRKVWAMMKTLAGE